jgi:hypothetical protein
MKTCKPEKPLDLEEENYDIEIMAEEARLESSQDGETLGADEESDQQRHKGEIESLAEGNRTLLGVDT